jgi:hypothetical protein
MRYYDCRHVAALLAAEGDEGSADYGQERRQVKDTSHILAPSASFAFLETAAFASISAPKGTLSRHFYQHALRVQFYVS